MTVHITARGNLGADPDIKLFNDKAIINFSLAVTPRIYKNNEWSDGETIWFRVSTSQRAEVLGDTLKKGDTVIVSGQMRQSTYTDKNNVSRTSLEINAQEVGIVPKGNRKAEMPAW